LLPRRLWHQTKEGCQELALEKTGGNDVGVDIACPVVWGAAFAFAFAFDFAIFIFARINSSAPAHACAHAPAMEGI
jgi:hypothetical protein